MAEETTTAEQAPEVAEQASIIADATDQATETAEQTQETAEQASILASDGEQTEQAEQTEQTEESAEQVDYAAVALPEGVELDTEALEQFTPFLQEHKVTAEAAEGLFAKFHELQSQKQQAMVDQYNQQREANRTEISKIPAEDLGAAKAAKDKFFSSDEAKQALDGYLGDTPWIVNALAEIGKAMSEDAFVDGSGARNERSAADIMFPTMAKK